MKIARLYALLLSLCLIFAALTPTFAQETKPLFYHNGRYYHGSFMSVPYFYTVENGCATLTDCIDSVSGTAVLPEALGGYPLTGIASGAFDDCLNLTAITVSDSVTNIEEGAFDPSADLTLSGGQNSACQAYAKAHAIPFFNAVRIGDTDADGVSGLSDLTLLMQFLAGWSKKIEAKNADVYENLQVELSDLTELAKILSGQERPATLFLVGDSTVCDYKDGSNFRALGGWGQYLQDYMDAGVRIRNLASSGASSKDYITRPVYMTLRNNLQKGDYLFIALGINDNKHNDESRYTDPNGSYTDEGTYPYYLYHYYVQLALDVGAHPVFVSSVCRRPADGVTFSNADLRITADQPGKPGGDYPKAMQNLAQTLGLPFIEMTQASKNLHLSLGQEQNALLHRWETADVASLDETHYSIWGAKHLARLVACGIKENVPALASYVQNETVLPDLLTFSTRLTQTESPSVFRYSDGTESITYDTLISADSYTVGENAALTEVHLADGVLTIGKEAFSGQSQLQVITLPDTLEYINIGAFFGCAKMALSKLPENLAVIHYNAFYGCESITIESIPASVTEIGASAFRGCKSITKLSVNASLDTIGSGVFRDCTALQSISLPLFLNAIPEGTFYSCTSLSTLVLPQYVTSLEKNALRSTAISKLVLPQNIISLGDYVFYGCKNLKTLHYEGTKDEFLQISKSENWSYASKFTSIVCSDQTI